MVKEQGLRQSN